MILANISILAKLAGLFYRMLLTAGNVVGTGKDRKGGKTAKDRLTVGLFCNATGTDRFKPVFIGKAMRPRCFGKHWSPDVLPALYYHNEAAWMRGDIWLHMLKEFNKHCYKASTDGTGPVILLADNCKAHTIPPTAEEWRSGDLRGFKLSNVLVIFFAPNCTSEVQPLDAGNTNIFLV